MKSNSFLTNMQLPRQKSLASRSDQGFSLVEVILAIGIFLITILALIGLLGPTLKTVDQIEETEEIPAVVSTLDAFLNSSLDIETEDQSRFEVIYNAVDSNNEATVFIFRAFRDDASSDILLRVGFAAGFETVGPDATLSRDDFSNAAGPIYRVVLTPSSVLSTDNRSSERDDNTKTFTLSGNYNSYEEGYFAMEARIFAEPPPGPNGNFDETTVLEDLADVEPIFSYNVAINR